MPKTKVGKNTPNKVPTPINAHILAHELEGYNSGHLVNDFENRFRYGRVGEHYLQIHRNHNSVFQNQQIVQDKLSG